jgi:hypothetical protein
LIVGEAIYFGFIESFLIISADFFILLFLNLVCSFEAWILFWGFDKRYFKNYFKGFEENVGKGFREYINHKKNEKPRDNRQLELTSDLAIFTLQNNRKLRERIEDLEKKWKRSYKCFLLFNKSMLITLKAGYVVSLGHYFRGLTIFGFFLFQNLLNSKSIS